MMYSRDAASNIAAKLEAEGSAVRLVVDIGATTNDF